MGWLSMLGPALGGIRSVGGAVNGLLPVSRPVPLSGGVMPGPGPQSPPLPPAIWGDGTQVYQGGVGDTSTPLGGVNQTQPVGQPQMLQAGQMPSGWGQGPIWQGSQQARMLETGASSGSLYGQSGGLGQLGQARTTASAMGPSWLSRGRG